MKKLALSALLAGVAGICAAADGYKPRTYWGDEAYAPSSFEIGAKSGDAPFVRFAVGGSWDHYVNKVAGISPDDAASIDFDLSIRLLEKESFRTFLNIGYSFAPEQDLASGSFGDVSAKLKTYRNALRVTVQPELALTQRLAFGLNLGVQESWYHAKLSMSDATGWWTGSDNYSSFQGLAGAYLLFKFTENIGVSVFCDYVFGQKIKEEDISFRPDMLTVGGKLVFLY